MPPTWPDVGAGIEELPDGQYVILIVRPASFSELTLDEICAHVQLRFERGPNGARASSIGSSLEGASKCQSARIRFLVTSRCYEFLLLCLYVKGHFVDGRETVGRPFDSLNGQVVGPFDEQPKGVMKSYVASLRWLADSFLTEIGMEYGR